MLLLLTIGLVLIGAVALVIGFVGGEQLPIFISIICSLLAGAVLVVFSRVSRRQPATVGAGPVPATADEGAAEEEAPPEVEEELVEEPSPVLERAPAGRAAEPAWDGDDDEFPIEDYDELLVSEILPLLSELDPDELEMVRQREEAGKSRATLLRRIEQLSQEMEPEPVGAGAAGSGATQRMSSTALRERDSGFADEEDEDDEDLGDEELVFPIEDYDDLNVSEILPLLPELYDDELEMVRQREEAGSNRRSVLNRIDELLGEEAPPPPPKKAAPKKAAAKKTAAKKTAKKAAAKKAAAKKAGGRKAAPKKAAAKKTAAKKTAKKSTKRR